MVALTENVGYRKEPLTKFDCKQSGWTENSIKTLKVQLHSEFTKKVQKKQYDHYLPQKPVCGPLKLGLRHPINYLKYSVSHFSISEDKNLIVDSSVAIYIQSCFPQKINLTEKKPPVDE